MWDLHTRQNAHTAQTGPGVRHLAVDASRDTRVLLAAGGKDGVHVYAAGILHLEHRLNTGPVHAMCFAGGGADLVAVATGGRTIALWDIGVPSPNPAATVTCPGTVVAVAGHRSTSLFMAATADKTWVGVYDAQTRACVASVAQLPQAPVVGVAMDGPDRYYCAYQGTVVQYNKRGTTLRAVRTWQVAGDGIRCVAAADGHVYWADRAGAVWSSDGPVAGQTPANALWAHSDYLYTAGYVVREMLAWVGI